MSLRNCLKNNFFFTYLVLFQLHIVSTALFSERDIRKSFGEQKQKTAEEKKPK